MAELESIAEELEKDMTSLQYAGKTVTVKYKVSLNLGTPSPADFWSTVISLRARTLTDLTAAHVREQDSGFVFAQMDADEGGDLAHRARVTAKRAAAASTLARYTHVDAEGLDD